MNRRAIAAPALALLVFAAGCNPQPQHAAQPSATPSTGASGLPPLKITGYSGPGKPVTITQQTGNRKEYQLVAKSLTSRSTQSVGQATFQQAAVTFYGKDGTTLVAHAPTARIDEKHRAVVMTGGVHATTGNGMTLTCDRLTYDQQSSLLHGEGNVRITGMQGGQQQVLTGNTFTSDVKLTNMVMK